MPKTKGTIMINPERTVIKDMDDFMGRIFFRSNSPNLVSNTKFMLNVILNEGISDKERERIKKDLNITDKTYYSIIKRLRSLGMITKKERVYRVSKKFSLCLKYLSDYWEAYISDSYNKKERITFEGEEKIDRTYKFI